MEEKDVHDIAWRGLYANDFIHGSLEETHISWVILAKGFAFKIKKPVRLSFLDFSTLALRKKLCEKELMLNRRFSNIYLDVLPVRKVQGQWIIGGPSDMHTVDYCVVMKRMATAKRLDKLLQKNAVSVASLKTLAADIALFHNNAQQTFRSFSIDTGSSIFNDIESVSEFARDALGIRYHEIIRESIEWSDAFLTRHQGRFQQRIDSGMQRDVHGDLHSGNIFLYTKPVLFDCIEFNDVYRQIDVLYEVAFLCMDLERFNQWQLADVFLTEYVKRFSAFQQPEDYSLFIYFKSLRANIRAKVHAEQCRQTHDTHEQQYHRDEAAKYLKLMAKYVARKLAYAHHD
jgi:aminoglycoside phosphotransferase family enzyme